MFAERDPSLSPLDVTPNFFATKPYWSRRMGIFVCNFSFHFFTDPVMVGPDTGRARVRFTNANGSQQTIMQPYKGITYASTSTVDETFTKVLVYPNPSDVVLYIESDFSENSVLQITDLLGKTIKTIAVNKGENKIQIKNLPPNFYFVRVNEKICEKILVR